MIFIIIAARDIRCSLALSNLPRAPFFPSSFFPHHSRASRSNSLTSRYLLSLINFPLCLVFLFPRVYIRCTDEKAISRWKRDEQTTNANRDELPVNLPLRYPPSRFFLCFNCKHHFCRSSLILYDTYLSRWFMVDLRLLSVFFKLFRLHSLIPNFLHSRYIPIKIYRRECFKWI